MMNEDKEKIELEVADNSEQAFWKRTKESAEEVIKTLESEIKINKIIILGAEKKIEELAD